MSKRSYPHPSIEDEKQFHSRNATIHNMQAELGMNQNLSYSKTAEFIRSIKYMRKQNNFFNYKYGLHKEIA